MIRILQLCSTSDLGGAERMVLNLASALPADEIETHIGALVGTGALMAEAQSAGLPAVHFRFRHAADVSGIRRLKAYCKEHKIDIVQTHGLRADGVARWAARLAGVRVIISTLHSVDPWRRWPHVLLDRLTAPLVTQFVAVCDAARQASVRREKLDPSRCVVVPIGVPERTIPREHRDAIRAELGLTDDDFPVVGVLANLRDMKGHRTIIQALPALRQVCPQVRFLFAGRDDSNGEIARLAHETGVDDAIRFLGFVEEPSRLFAAMDILLLASQWEGFPVSILEAMQAGVPVIATSVGGIPEMIRDGQDGLLIPPASPEAITTAVSLLSRDFALRATLVKSADARYRSEFTLDQMSRKMTHLYRLLYEKA